MRIISRKSKIRRLDTFILNRVAAENLLRDSATDDCAHDTLKRINAALLILHEWEELPVFERYTDDAINKAYDALEFVVSELESYTFLNDVGLLAA